MSTTTLIADYAMDDIVIYVGQQVPRAVAPLLKEVAIMSDPFHLRTIARFTTHKGRVLECALENEKFGMREVACKIPELFLARLCVECP
jgi:hypothetical protein